MVSKTQKTRQRKARRDPDAPLVASKPLRDLPKPKSTMTMKRRYRLLGMAPTPGVYEDFENIGKEVYECETCGKEKKVKNFCVNCAVNLQKIKTAVFTV
eukprot:NODE_7965_length_399_cov_7.750000_g7799_i0.p2 GENE.NODE_7965_length_399_cov_7.750000_g7799_i0~~NODE_7965_length_399_cov_7.750000_g7799_i0.p2  ORF type:complete len:116 (+),score=43.31 NODE_7965_length_399_cov_7.750000_g7799_i0:53-349(+)